MVGGDGGALRLGLQMRDGHAWVDGAVYEVALRIESRISEPLSSVRHVCKSFEVGESKASKAA